MQSDSPHYHGHRKRLKERLRGAPANLADYEILELLLCSAVPRRDVKPLAKELLHHCHSLPGVLNASQEKLMSVEGVTEAIYTQILLCLELNKRVLKQSIMKQEVLSSWSAVLNYLKVAMGSLQTEQFRVLFLNTKNLLIADELQPSGTIDQTVAYPREIIKRALFHSASAIILVHNHPSGDPSPSKADITLTNKIVDACGAVGIRVHDHVIMTSNDYYSFKANLLL